MGQRQRLRVGRKHRGPKNSSAAVSFEGQCERLAAAFFLDKLAIPAIPQRSRLEVRIQRRTYTGTGKHGNSIVAPLTGKWYFGAPSLEMRFLSNRALRPSAAITQSST